MANYKLVDGDQLDTDLKAIADKIREKGNTTDELAFPQGYTDAIDAIKTGGGGGVVKDKGYVNFYDYEGTLLYSYSKEETEALTELPPLPEHDGLVCQGWNWSLEDIKAEGKETDIGAMYITDDGKTRLYITIAAEGRMDVPLYFCQTVANGVTIDWGDGSVTEILAGTGNVNTTHTYATIGDYVISLDVADGCTLGFGCGGLGYCMMGVTGAGGSIYCNMLRKVEIGNRVSSITNYSFSNCYSLANIVMPEGLTAIGENAFCNCYSLANIVMPKGVIDIWNYSFSNCYSCSGIILPKGLNNIRKSSFRECRSLANITIPEGVKSIGAFSFYACYSLANLVIPEGVTIIDESLVSTCYALTDIVIPNGVTSIGNNSFNSCYALANLVIPNEVTIINSNAFIKCYGVKFYDFTKHTAVPTLAATNALTNIPSDCEIRVPAALYDEWIAATNWSTYADKIVAR